VAISTTRIASVDIATGKTMWSHSYAPSGMVAPSPDGTEVVIGQRLAHDHDVYSLAGGTVLGTVEIDSRALLAVDWSPDGRWLVAAGDDERPRLWDVVAAVTRDEYPTIAPYAAGGSWAPDSRRVALADAYDHRVMVVDVTGATADEDLSISTDVVLVATAWAPAGDRLAAIGRDGTVFAWEVTT
jgi:WD40 repeat protein